MQYADSQGPFSHCSSLKKSVGAVVQDIYESIAMYYQTILKVKTDAWPTKHFHHKLIWTLQTANHFQYHFVSANVHSTKRRSTVNLKKLKSPPLRLILCCSFVQKTTQGPQPCNGKWFALRFQHTISVVSPISTTRSQIVQGIMAPIFILHEFSWITELVLNSTVKAPGPLGQTPMGQWVFQNLIYATTTLKFHSTYCILHHYSSC